MKIMTEEEMRQAHLDEISIVLNALDEQVNDLIQRVGSLEDELNALSRIHDSEFEELDASIQELGSEVDRRFDDLEERDN